MLKKTDILINILKELFSILLSIIFYIFAFFSLGNIISLIMIYIFNVYETKFGKYGSFEIAMLIYSTLSFVGTIGFSIGYSIKFKFGRIFNNRKLMLFATLSGISSFIFTIGFSMLSRSFLLGYKRVLSFTLKVNAISLFSTILILFCLMKLWKYLSIKDDNKSLEDVLKTSRIRKQLTVLLVVIYSIVNVFLLSKHPTIKQFKANISHKIHRWRVVSKMPLPDIDNSAICKNTIVYISRIPGGSEIWSMDEYGQNKVNLSQKNPSRDRVPFDTVPKWSPDGRMILFSAKRNGIYGVYIMSCDGSIQYLVAKTGSNNNYPDWSPDGQCIVYSDLGTLNVVDYTGKNNRTIFQGYTFGPSFSPNGEQIAYCVKSKSDHGYVCNLELINLDGTDRRTLIADRNYNFGPKWINNDIISYSTEIEQKKTNSYKNPIYQSRYFSISLRRNIENFKESDTIQNGRIRLSTKNNQIFVIGPNGEKLRQLTFEGWNYNPDVKRNIVKNNRDREK